MLQWVLCSLVIVGHCSAISSSDICLQTGRGYEYSGNLSKTISGRTCRGWSTQKPHRHRCTKLNHRHNYCSNNQFYYCRKSKPWCYTTDPKVSWEYCDIPMCQAPLECRTAAKGFDYKGRQSKTVSGRTCQAWEAQEPHKHDCTSINQRVNYCTNDPNPRCEAAVPWCYTTDPATVWEYCDIPMCHDLCLETPAGFEYRGHHNRTKSGRTCQAWSSQKPHEHNCSVAFDRVSRRENYCSNTQDDPCGSSRPWCYTTDPRVPWEHCDIPLCSDLNVCKSEPCQHGGTCAKKGTGYMCACNSTYKGELCQTFDACLSQPCANDGFCAALGRRYQCTCIGTFSGTDCEIVDACKSRPCRNGGTCLKNGADHQCICRSSYTGNNCGVDVLLCVNADVRCLRRGERTINGIFMSCDNCRKYVDARSDNETWLSCRDVQGWGFNAETRQCQFQSPHCYPCDDPCYVSPCENGGTCKVDGNQYECSCRNGTFGYRCQFDSSVCPSNPCKNGGECVMDGAYNDTMYYAAYPRCKCRMGYSGAMCGQCVGVFKRIRNRSHRGGNLRVDKKTARGCKEACMEANIYCAAIDFIRGACTVHYKNDYDNKTLVFNNRATHYRLMPCSGGQQTVHLNSSATPETVQ